MFIEFLFDTQTTSGHRRLSGIACFEFVYIKRDSNNAVKLHRCIASMWKVIKMIGQGFKTWMSHLFCQRARTVIVGWFASRTLKNYSSWYT